MSASNETESAQPQGQAIIQDRIIQRQHTVSIAGQTINYTVSTGTFVLKRASTKSGENAGEFEGDKPKAEFFFIAYTRDDVDIRQRPITFSFNGGPGSSSVWLHLGVLGPRRVDMVDTEVTKPPYCLLDNNYSLLDQSDLVFIDPVGTGYSRPVPGEKSTAFHSLKEDIASVAEFIHLYCSRHGRWASPKFLAGESYGTTRAAGLAEHLQERHGMYLNGLMLISSVLDFSTLRFASNNDLPHILYLPTFSATAWYHQKLSPAWQERPLRELLDEVEAFAIGEYATALMKGSSLSSAEQEQIAERLAAYTGLSLAYVQHCNLRPEIMRFTKELLRSERRTVGRLDSRFKAKDRDSAGMTFEFDPSMAAIMGPYTACFNHYVREELGYESDFPYEIISMDVNKGWRWESDNQYVDVAEKLRKSMNLNPHLKVHVANGYFDLATPHLATEYTFNHLMLDPGLQDNISMSYYEAGHMMYVHQPSLEALKQELSRFIAEAL
ncbi:MAG: peptidase S10 [Chloroflexi bacterium AL-N5]|nr:peptidase S10 [Chloroflexi bacterium AL-N5]